MSKYLLRVDELNNFMGRLNATNERPQETDIVDEMLDFLLLAYADGKLGVENDLGKETENDTERMHNTLYRKIEGKDWTERLHEYVQSGDMAGIERLANTERHRIYNESAYNTAKELGATKKVWNGIMDDKIRDSHFYLDGTVKDIDEPFYTILGNEGMFPGQFGVADEDVNCRCSVTYIQ